MPIIKNFISRKVGKAGKLISKSLTINYLNSNLLTQSLPITINSLPLYLFPRLVYQQETFAIVEVYTVYRVFTH